MSEHKTAIVSVYDKTGVVEFCKHLAAAGWTIISTGGTEKALKEAGVAVKAVFDVTKFPEILGGRVKTLHPSVCPFRQCVVPESHLFLIPWMTSNLFLSEWYVILDSWRHFGEKH